MCFEDGMLQANVTCGIRTRDLPLTERVLCQQSCKNEGVKMPRAAVRDIGPQL